MMSSIRNRLIFIVILVAMALWGLRPREVSVATAADGTDSTETRWGLKLGLDLQGGMHLAIEIDQSAGPVTNPEDAIDRVETVIRSRVDEFGVAEPLIQKVGNKRLIIQLPGIRDPGRAKQIIERSAFLEFRITDMQGQFEASLERIDRALERAGVVVGDEAETPGAARTAFEQLLGPATDTTTQSTDSAGTTDSLDVDADAPVTAIFSRFLNQSQLPGEFLVADMTITLTIPDAKVADVKTGFLAKCPGPMIENPANPTGPYIPEFTDKQWVGRLKQSTLIRLNRI